MSLCQYKCIYFLVTVHLFSLNCRILLIPIPIQFHILTGRHLPIAFAYIWYLCVQQGMSVTYYHCILPDVLLEQILVGPSPNLQLLSYLRHAVATQVQSKNFIKLLQPNAGLVQKKLALIYNKQLNIH